MMHVNEFKYFDECNVKSTKIEWTNTENHQEYEEKKNEKELNANYYWMIIMDNRLYFQLERFEIVCSKNIGAFDIRDTNGRMKNAIKKHTNHLRVQF